MRFLLKSLQALRIAGKTRRQEFKRGFAPRGNVGGQIDVAHAAGADPFRNFVVTDRATDEQVSLPILHNLRRETKSCSFNSGTARTIIRRKCLVSRASFRQVPMFLRNSFLETASSAST